MASMIESVYFSDDVSGIAHHHYHDCHQLLLIQRGEVSVSFGQSETIARAGDIVISNRFEDHAITVRSAVYERYLLRLRPSALPLDGAFSFLTLRPPHFQNPVSTGADFARFASLFDALLRESAYRDGFSAQMQQMLVTELLIGICRLEGEHLPELDDEDRTIVLALQREFEEHYRSPYTLSDLAERYAISVSALSHRFKAIVGVSVMEYLVSCRMAAAKRYLSETGKSIGEIVEICGFTDGSNFSRTFKSRTGMTPSEFRERYGRKGREGHARGLS